MHIRVVPLVAFMSVALSLAHIVPAAAQDDFTYSLSVEEYLNNALPPQEGRSINFNEATGILTVTDTPTNQKLIRRLVQQFDIGPQQVMIEARFVEISFTDLDELGIEWYWRKEGDIEFNRSTTGSAISVTDRVTGAVRESDYVFNPDYEGVRWDSSFPQAGFGLGLIMSQWESNNFITAYLQALASEGRANLLSSPKVTTLSGQMANIQITETIPYVSDVDFENSGTAEHPIWQFEYTIEERITGITLEVTPFVSSESEVITLEIHPEVSNLIERRPIFVGDDDNPFTSGASVPDMLGWPIVDTRTAQTSVMVQSGETVVMGGFVNDDDTEENKKVPLLGDIPLIGNLFKYKYKERTKKNLVIFLTATLITADGSPASIASQ